MSRTPLALHGGPKCRPTPMPARRAMGPQERAQVMAVLDHYAARDVDPGYEGVFERDYCAAFAAYMGGGYADSVATGTASVYVALAACGLPPGAEVIIGPITDAGPVNSIILQGYVPVLADAAPGRYNMSAETFAARITPKTKALILVHCIGEPIDMDAVMAVADRHGILVIEDCSQSHGARWNGRKIGTFGEIAAFSTMFKKTHISGSSGGIVYSKIEDRYHLALAHADRGKPRWRTDFDDRSPMTNMFPALNWNTDEISCAIGQASLARLDETIAARLAYIDAVATLLPGASRFCRPYGHSPDFSPFIYPIFVDTEGLSCTKREFAEAVRAEGIDLNPHYGFVVWDWPWVRPYLSDDFSTPNARDARDRSFCLYLNERYGRQEAEDTVAAIAKVEAWFAR